MQRRDLLPAMLGFGAAFAAATAPAVAAASAGRDEPGNGLPQTAADHLRNLVRMQGSLDEDDVPWWFTSRVAAQGGGARSLHVGIAERENRQEDVRAH